LESSVVSAAAPRFELESYELTPAGLKQLRLAFPDESLWKDDPEFRGWALQGRSLHRLSQDGQALVAAGPIPLKSTLNERGWTFNRFQYNEQTRPASQIYEMLFNPIIAYDLGLKSDDQRDQFELPSGILKVYLYGRMPDQFEIRGHQFPQQNGRVIYTRTFRLHENSQ
jgi:hypothetical protein